MNPDEYGKMYSLEDHYWWFVGRRQLAIRMLETCAGRDRGLRILDLGCGTGAVAADLAARHQVVGVDMSPLALGFARRRGLERLAIGDGTALPFRTGSMDVVVALDILEHIPDDVAAFAEAFRVLKPGGRLVLSVPAFRWLWGPHDVALHHHRRYRRQEVEIRLREAGFAVERASYAVFLLFPAVIGSRFVEKLRPGPAKASLPKFPESVNGALKRVQAAEQRWITEGGKSLPWGSSVVAVGVKS